MLFTRVFIAGLDRLLFAAVPAPFFAIRFEGEDRLDWEAAFAAALTTSANRPAAFPMDFAVETNALPVDFLTVILFCGMQDSRVRYFSAHPEPTLSLCMFEATERRRAETQSEQGFQAGARSNQEAGVAAGAPEMMFSCHIVAGLDHMGRRTTRAVQEF